MRKRKPPKINVRLSMEPLIVSGGWFADVQAVCEFNSHENGYLYVFSVPLKPNSAKLLTDLLLHPQATGDFDSTQSEKKRISAHIAETLGLIVARQPEWYRKRRYPLKFAKY